MRSEVGGEVYCYTTGTPVAQSGMRPGYDCRCTGCITYVNAKLMQGINPAKLEPESGRSPR